jgi:hypothetical protein
MHNLTKRQKYLLSKIVKTISAMNTLKEDDEKGVNLLLGALGQAINSVAAHKKAGFNEPRALFNKIKQQVLDM